MGVAEYTEEELETRATGIVLKSPEALVQSLENRFALTPGMLQSRRHLARRLAYPRALLFEQLRKAGWSYPEIGRFMSGRDHTTIVQAVDRARKKGWIECP
jgi:chromosomal replication initiation ATPase DnaA